MANEQKERVARELAQWHFNAKPEMTKIIWVDPHGGDDEPLRFLEVLPGRSGVEHGIEVFAFDATDDVPYPSEVVMVTEKELTLVVADVLSLPEGWSLTEAKTFTRAAHMAADEGTDAR